MPDDILLIWAMIDIYRYIWYFAISFINTRYAGFHEMSIYHTITFERAETESTAPYAKEIYQKFLISAA